MLPIPGSNVPHISNTSTRSNLLTQTEAIHEQASGEGQSIVQASENCVVSNQLYGENHTAITNFFLTASDSNTKLIFEKLNASAETTRYKPLAQLGTQIEELRTAYLNVLEEVDEIRDGLALYIPSEGQETADSQTSFTLVDKVREFLSSKKKVLLLLGEAGSGKSTFNRHLTRMLWDEYQQSSAAPLPIFIALAEHTPSREDLIESYLLEQEFSPEVIAMLRKEKRLVFILDGFDEIQDRTQAFYTHNKLDHWKNAQVIISSRPEYLGENYRSQFQKRGQTSALQEYWLSPTSDDWITAYIQKYIRHTQRTGWNLKRYQGTLNNLPTLKEAIRRPFLLQMALDLLPDLTASKSVPITRIALYDAFISRWWNRSEERLQHITLTAEEEKARGKLGQYLAAKGLKASQEMAIALTRKRLIQASYDPEKDEIIPEAWRMYLDEKDAEKRLLLFNAPLIHQRQHYRFIHKSIQDYCVARAICGPRFNSAQTDVDAVLNQFLLVDEPLILDFLAERVKQYSAFKAHLYTWIEASKDLDAVVTVGAANAMTILVRAGVGFNGADLNRIRIPGADLSYGVFDSAQLKGSDLSGVNFRQVWLREANLSGAQMSGVQFGEWAYLKEESWVLSCAYSPDGQACAMGLRSNKIRVYNTSSWTKLHSLKGHTDRVLSVVYSPSGEQIASGSGDCTVRLWDVQSGESVRTLRGHTNSVSSVAYSPSGTQLASGSNDNTVRLWDAQSGESVRTLRGHTNSVWSVAYSPHGTQLASGSNDNTVRLWDVQSGETGPTLCGHMNSVWSVAYSPHGTQLASGSVDNTVRLWDVQSGESVRTLLGHTGCVYSVAYSPTGTQLASGSDDCTVRLWDVQRGELGPTLRGHTGGVRSVAYSPHGTQLASGSDDKTVRLWDVQRGESGPTLRGHTGGVRSVAYSPHGTQLASGSYDKTVRLWDEQSGESVRTLLGHTDYVYSVAYSPHGTQLASGSNDNTVRLWDVQSGESGPTLRGHTSAVNSVAYSPHGTQLASGSYDNTVRLWDVQSGVSGPTLRGHTGGVRSVAYSPHGTQLASGSYDKTVRLWDVQSGESVRTLLGHTDYVYSVAYSPHGTQLASGSYDNTVRLWDVQSGESGPTLRGHTSVVNSVAYSPHGTQLASGSYDNTVRLWNVSSGQCLRKVEGFRGAVESVAWQGLPEEEYLLAGGRDKLVRKWEVKKDGGGYKLKLRWMSMHEELMVTDMLIEGVIGLSEVNHKMLNQRGAVFSVNRLLNFLYKNMSV